MIFRLVARMDIYKKITYLCFDYFQAEKSLNSIFEKHPDDPGNQECSAAFEYYKECLESLKETLIENGHLYEDLSSLS